MKKVLLIGDSVRMGYDKYVKESMQSVAEVFYPAENCMFSSYILRNLHFWVSNMDIYDADAVHWNAGLWDTVRIYNDEPLVDLDTYKYNVGRIIKRMRFLFPKAKIIFATSTPCIEDGYIKDFEMRYNSDVEKYNKAACEICKKSGVSINDLYCLLKDKPESFHSDQTHYYTAAATELIGAQVNRVICNVLGIDEKELTVPDAKEFEIPKSKSDKELFVKHGNYYEYAL